MSVNFSCRYCTEQEISVISRQLSALYFCKWQFHISGVTNMLFSLSPSLCLSLYLSIHPSIYLSLAQFLSLSTQRSCNLRDANLKGPRLFETKLHILQPAARQKVVPRELYSSQRDIMKSNLKRGKSKLVIYAPRPFN